jgi:hypothetical protein
VIELEMVFTPDSPSDEWRRVALLRVDGDAVYLEGDETAIDFSLPVVSIRTGGQVLFQDDREEWARALPSAYRTGDIVVRVLHDDEPLRDDELQGQPVERHQVHLRERLGQHA